MTGNRRMLGAIHAVRLSWYSFLLRPPQKPCSSGEPRMMAGRSLFSSAVLARRPSSPNATTRERACDGLLELLHLPSRSFSATTYTFSSIETTLCDTKRFLDDILDVQSETSITSIASQTSPKIHSKHCLGEIPSSHAKRRPLSPEIRYPSLSQVSDPAYLLPPMSSRRTRRAQSGRCSSFMRSPRNHQVHSTVCGGGRISEVKAEDYAGGALGLILGTKSHPHTRPQTTYSTRLRRIAPPPLPLSLSPSSQFALPALSPKPDLASVSSVFTQVSITPCPPSSRCAAVSPVTVLELPDDRPSTSLSSFEILQWRRRVSCAVETPLSPLNPDISSVPSGILPSAPPCTPTIEPIVQNSSLSLRAPLKVLDEPPTYPQSLDTSTSNILPPPLPRPHLMSLPSIPYQCSESESDDQLLSPLGSTLRDALSIPSFIMHAERCSEAIRDAAPLLCSCTLLKDPEAILDVCKSIQRTLGAIQEELDKTPEDRDISETDDLDDWVHKHWQTMSSLERNLNLFYLFADQLRRAPPRIHRLASHVEKLHAYHDKFVDLSRRLAISHEKLRLVELRAKYVAEHQAARMEANAERIRRREFRETWNEGRALRKAMREEIRRARKIAQQARSESAFTPENASEYSYPEIDDEY